MLSTEPQELFFPRQSFGTDSREQTTSMLHGNSYRLLWRRLIDLGAVDDLAVMFQVNPLSAEFAFRDSHFGMGRRSLDQTFVSTDDFGSSLEVEGENYNLPSTGHAMTVLGPVEFPRARYRPTRCQGENFIPAEHQLGLTVGSLTSVAASLSMALLSSLTARESADVWQRVASEGPSDSTLVRLFAEDGRCLEECSTEVMDELGKQEELPEYASMVQVRLDGVMMRMNAEKIGDDVIEEARWREASCGTGSVFDKDGHKLQSRYLGRLPERKKQCLKKQLRQEMDHSLGQNPDLRLVVCADGAKDNWTFAESLNPDVEVLDFWHATVYLKVAADVVFGSNEKASTKWFEAEHHTLRHDPKGVGKVIDALRHLLRKGRSSAEIQKTLGYFRNSRSRMNYYRVAKDGYPIGSGEVEAANNMLVTHRLKRSGQRWGRDGGQEILTYRALMKFDHLDRAWRITAPKMERSTKQWDPVKTTANYNRQIRDAA